MQVCVVAHQMMSSADSAGSTLTQLPDCRLLHRGMHEWLDLGRNNRADSESRWVRSRAHHSGEVSIRL
jgi:hypothetical protein